METSQPRVLSTGTYEQTKEYVDSLISGQESITADTTEYTADATTIKADKS